MFDDEDLKDISNIARMVAEQGLEETKKALERIRERNRAHNLEVYGCNCPAAKCYASCPKYLTHDKHADLLDFLVRTNPPDRREKDPLPTGKPSGKSSSQKVKKRKKPLTYKNLYLEC